MIMSKNYKIKEGYVLKEVGGKFLAVPVGSASLNFNAMITVNDSGILMWNLLSSGAGATIEDLTVALRAEYEVDESVASCDVEAFVKNLSDARILDE
jgi:hypothetical protein